MYKVLLNEGADTGAVRCDNTELEIIEASCAIIRKPFFNSFAWDAREAVPRRFDNWIERAR